MDKVKDTRGDSQALTNNRHKTGKDSTKLMARYEMENKGQAATQGTNIQKKTNKQTNKADGKRQSGINSTRPMARYMMK